MEATPQEIDITKLAISPISEPMASEKLTAKAIGLVSKLAKVKLIKRGVKEVNKFFRRKENKKQKRQKQKEIWNNVRKRNNN